MLKEYDFTGDYTTKLDGYVNELVKKKREMDRESRMTAVEHMTDEYIIQTGKRPDVKPLLRLTDFVLHDELSDPHPDKITRNEFPILSDRQYRKRTEGKERRRNTAGVVTREVPLTHAQYVATDELNYSAPSRSFHNPN